MKGKRVIILIFQIAIAIALAIGLYAYVQGELNPTEIYVFNKNLPVNAEITEADITPVSVSGNSVIPGSEQNKANIVGKFVGHDVVQNQTVFSSSLKEEGDLNPIDSMDLSEYRKISLPISLVEGFGGNIASGDKVDLVYIGKGTADQDLGANSPFSYGKTFLQDVMVYNVTTGNGLPYVDQTDFTGVDSSGEPIEAGNSSRDLSVITLMVTLDQAEEIATRQEAGSIRFVSRFDEHESYETLGFVMGEYDSIFAAPGDVEKSTLGY